MIEKDTLLMACGGRNSDYEISKTMLGVHIVFFWSWALPLFGVLWLLSRPFHYLGELAEVLFQIWKMNQRRSRRDYVRDFDELWGSAEGCWDTCIDEPEECCEEGYRDMAQTLLNNAEEHEHIMYDRNGNTHRVGEVDGKFTLKTESLGADRLCFNRVYYTDEHGVDHPVKSYEFSYYYENGERVLFNGDLYNVYALCEPSYILRDPTGSVMSSVKVTESDLEKVDV